MNRTIILISIIVLLATAGCRASGNAPEMETAGAVGRAQPVLDEISTGLVIPAALPETITDPLLMQGWITLYNRQDAIELWDGATISGRQLALYVIDQSVEITWNRSKKHNGSWVDRGKTGIVYIDPEIRTQADGQLTSLVELLAHELFHHTTPFGQQKDTLYEEYWSFYAGAYIAGVGEGRFFYTNPLNNASLEEWFKENNHSNYLKKYERYPVDIASFASK
jgi:hypothetical protein